MMKKQSAFEGIDNAPEEKEEISQLQLHILDTVSDQRHYAHVDCPGALLLNMIIGAAQMDELYWL